MLEKLSELFSILPRAFTLLLAQSNLDSYRCLPSLRPVRDIHTRGEALDEPNQIL